MPAKRKPSVRTNNKKARSKEFDQAQFVLSTFRNAQEMSRAMLHGRLGTQFGGKRDLYKTFGYPFSPDYHDYRNLYDRHGLAARIIDKFADSTWGKAPVLIDGNGRSDDIGEQATPFLVQWDKLVNRLGVYQIFRQADIMCGIGKYSIIFLGAPGESYAEPAGENGLFYLAAYDENQASITQFIQDERNEKFGMPAEYTVSFNSVDQGVQFTGGSSVHYSRVVHVSENRLGSRIYGRPRLQTIINRLFDLEKVTGGGAEAAWLAVYKGILLLPREGYTTPESDSPVMKNLDEQMTKLMNQIQRYAVIDGADVHDLGVEEVRIRDIYDTLKTDLSGSVGIPQRILFGAERGELASSQDQQEWNGTIKSRQNNFAEPEVLRPFVQWCIQHKVIPPPASGKFNVEWPPVYTMNEIERANYALVVAQGANTITNGVPDEAISIDEWRGELGMPPMVVIQPANPLIKPPGMVPGKLPTMTSLPDLLKAGGNGNGANGHGLAVHNDFEDHAGRPGKVGGSLPRESGGGGPAKDTGSRKILELLRDSPGGFSYRPASKDSPKGGYMTSIEDGPIFSPDLSDDEALQQIDSFLTSKADLLKGSNMYVGGWLNEEDGKFYLDASGNFDSLDETIKVAAATKQKAIFDMNTFNTVFLSDYLSENPGLDIPADQREWYAANPK